MNSATTVTLGPDLPMAVFTSTEIWQPERIGALALYCSDGRWGEAFDEFCHKSLRIPRYDRLAVPGGPIRLTQRVEPAVTESVRHELEFLVRVHELERVVLITHFGCAVYAHALQQEPEACLGVQLDDLADAADLLRHQFPGLAVEAYLAMRRHNCLSFHQFHT